MAAPNSSGATSGQVAVRLGGHALRRVLLIANPASRRGARLCSAAAAALRAAGFVCDTVLTEYAGHASDCAVAAAHSYDALFTLGGDGTAMEVIGATAPNGPPVGILPGGTGNMLARALGIPLNVRRAVRALASGGEARIDLGRLASGRRFAIGTGVGIDASMIATTPASWKRRIGVLSYIVAGTRQVIRPERFRARVTVDGILVERSASAVLVANFGVLLNGLITLGDGIRYDDGMLDVCMFDPRTVSDSARIARKLMLRDFSADTGMEYLRGSNITVSTDPSLPVQADGELIGTTPFEITTEPLAARLLVPHSQMHRNRRIDA
ncbi:MAG: diacylglycerol/lipid kinase family protein [Gemmatimonadaceae bacterium]